MTNAWAPTGNWISPDGEELRDPRLRAPRACPAVTVEPMGRAGNTEYVRRRRAGATGPVVRETRNGLPGFRPYVWRGGTDTAVEYREDAMAAVPRRLCRRCGELCPHWCAPEITVVRRWGRRVVMITDRMPPGTGGV